MCKVMEDLIRMHVSIFTVSLLYIHQHPLSPTHPFSPSLPPSLTHPFSPQIPAQLYEACLKSLLATDSAAVDLLLKRRCYEQG